MVIAPPVVVMSSPAERTVNYEDNEERCPPFVRLNSFGEHKRAISSVAFAPSRLLSRDAEAVLASASADGTCKLWRVPEVIPMPINAIGADAKGVNLSPLLTLVGQTRGLNHVAWCPSGTPHLATASDDKTCRLWDAETGEGLVEFRGHSNFCFCVKFNPSGNLLVSGSFDETVKLWDVRTGDCVSTLPAHSDPVTSVDINRDGTCIVSGSHDGLLRIWDTATGECLKTIYAPSNPPVSHVQYAPNGKYILAGTLDSKLRLWSVNNHPGSGRGCCKKTYASNDVVSTKYCIASDFLCSNPKRQCVVTGSENGNVVLYDLNCRAARQVLSGGHQDAVLAVSAHDSKELVASGGMTEDRTVQFWAPVAVDDSGEGKGVGEMQNAAAKRRRQE